MATTFHPFPNLPSTLQSDILTHALPQEPVLISAFWTQNNEDRTCALRLPTSQSFHALQSVATLNNPLLPLIPIHLKHKRRFPERQSNISSPTPPLPPPAPETIFLRPSIDILYIPFAFFQQSFSAWLDVPDFLSREENQQIKKLAISLTDFDEIVKSYSVRMPLPAWLRSPAEKLVLGLKNLEVLYVIGGDDGERLFLPWSPQARVKTERHGNEVKKVVVGKWTGEEEVEFVGLGEGTFQKQHNRFEGTRGEGDGIMGNPLPPTIDDVEERWKVVVEQVGKKEGMGEWIPPRVVGLEVKCREE